MGIIDSLRQLRTVHEELMHIECRNAMRRGSINSIITIATAGGEAAEDESIKSKHSKFKARAEGIRDWIDQIEESVKHRDITTARELDLKVGRAINELDASP